VPIVIGKDSQETQKRRKPRRLRRRRSRTFESAITVPQAVRRDSRQAKRTIEGTAEKRKKAKRSQATRTRTARTRAERKKRARQASSAASIGILQRINWRSAGWRLLALVVLAALISVMAYVSYDFSFFIYRDDTRIVGAHFLKADEIFAAAGVNEQNVFWIDPADVAARVVAMDGIKAASVRCDLPAAVTIEVEEREPVVMWRATSQEQDLWLDETGLVLPYHGDVNSPEMVFVVDFGQRQLQVGDRIEPKGIVKWVLQLSAELPGEQVYKYQPDRGLSFDHRMGNDEWPVYVGTGEALARKIQVVQALTQYLVENRISPSYVDVRWPEHPVYGKPEGDVLAEGD
jgi:cell division septal protein FtsQ